MTGKDMGNEAEKRGKEQGKNSIFTNLKQKIAKKKTVHAGDRLTFFQRIKENIRRLNKKAVAIIAGALVLGIAAAVIIPPVVRGIAEKRQAGEEDAYTVVHATPKPTSTPEPKEPPVIDLSAVTQTVVLESTFNKINEPTPWEEELLYSAGKSSGIDEMIFTKLYSYNMDTKVETEEAESQIRNKSNLPGELYEARMNDHWMVWLDTNQAGKNVIYGKDRLTGEAFTIKECALLRPQLRLYGNNLVYLIQESADQDCLYLYDMADKEVTLIGSFYQDPTYGTCPPAIFGDVVVWSMPNSDDPGTSILKWLDLSEGLEATVNDGAALGNAAVAPTPTPDPDASPDADAAGGEAGEGDETTVSDEGEGEGDMSGAAGEEDDPYINSGGIILPDHNYGEAIDPGSLAVYPVTNGDVVVYLDGLDPTNANLMMTRKGGEPVTIAHGVGRFYDVGSDFVVYTQNDEIFLYFWDIERYARLTAEGQKGRLSQACANGNTVVWYDFNDPNAKDDIVYVCTVETPSGALLEY